MTHVTDAAILALRDGVDADPGTTEHVEWCEWCGDALADARERAVTVAEALSALDRDFDLETARAAVRWRVARAAAGHDGARAIMTRAPSARGHLSRAAGVLLLFAAGAAAALPGSPVRSWLAGPPARGADAPEAASAPALEPLQTPGGAQVRVPGGSGPVLVSLDGVAPGSLVEVRFVDGSSIGVSAPEGTSFFSAEGRIEAAVAAGDVRVDLPRGSAQASVVVSGRTFVRRTASGLEVTGPVEARTGDVLRFRIPGR